MMKTLKTFAMAVALAGATVTAARAQVTLTPPYAVENLSVQLTATHTYQGEAKTNDHSGTITDVKDSFSILTGKFIALLATNLGVADLSPHATLIKVTSLTPAINFTNVLTSTNPAMSNYTVFRTNYLTYSYVFTNTTSNGAQFVTNLTDVTPTGYTFLYTTNVTTNVVQGNGDAVYVATNVQYFINNGTGFDTANFIPLSTSTNDNAGATGGTSDNVPGINRTATIDPVGNTYTSQGVTSNFFLAQEMTNRGHIFAGTITTNLTINGTLFGDTISISVGPPREPNGTTAPAQLNIAGTGNAAAASAVVANKTPFTSWNATFVVTGSGTVGGYVTNSLDFNRTTFSYVSNGVYITPSPTYNELFGFYGTNPPVLIGPAYFDGTNSIGYTNISTNYYTNYSVVSTNTAVDTTNTAFILTGTVVQSFVKIVQ
jgi:hypothetical protein